VTTKLLLYVAPDLTYQVTSQPVRQHTGRQPEDIRRGLSRAGQARIIEDSPLPGDAATQALEGDGGTTKW
jgi:hypothetical protein